MPTTYSTGFHKIGFHFEQPTTGTIKQRLVASSGCILELEPGAKFRNMGVTTTTGGLTRHATLNPDGLSMLRTSGVYLLNPYRGSHAVIVSYNTNVAFIKGDSDNIGAVHFQLFSATKGSTHPHCVKMQGGASQVSKQMGVWADIYGISTNYAVTKMTYSTDKQVGQGISSSTGS